MFKIKEKFFTPSGKLIFNHPAHSVITILTLKTADTLITFALAAAINVTKLHYTSKNETSY
jgi:hypothetical protein